MFFFFVCITIVFVIYLVLAIAILVAMALTLAPPKGFKLCGFSSRPYPSTSQLPSNDIVVSTLESSVQPTTLIGESSDK